MVRVCVFVIFFLPIVAVSQDPAGGQIHYYFTLFGQTEGKLAPSYQPFADFVAGLEQRRSSFRNDKAFLHHVFTRSHQRFFREFEEYASFSDLIANGKYNCLTGTALFGLMLDHFGIDHRIIETNHHIFLLVQTSQGMVLLETTDQVNGFVIDPRVVADRISKYTELTPERVNNRDSFNFQYPKLYKDTVSLTGVLGLLHYNHSVDAFNLRDYKTAIAHLSHALLLHRSEKLETYHHVLSTTILFDESLKEEIKQNHLARLRTLREKKRVRTSSVLMVPLIR